MKRVDRGPSRRERRKALKHIAHRHPRRVVATLGRTEDTASGWPAWVSQGWPAAAAAEGEQ